MKRALTFDRLEARTALDGADGTIPDDTMPTDDGSDGTINPPADCGDVLMGSAAAPNPPPPDAPPGTGPGGEWTQNDQVQADLVWLSDRMPNGVGAFTTPEFENGETIPPVYLGP